MMARLIPQSRCNNPGGLLVLLIALVCSACLSLVQPAAAEDLPQAGHLLDQPAQQVAAPGKTDALPGSANADGLPAAGHLVDVPEASAAGTPSAGLQLEVLINGYKSDLVAGFTKRPDGNLASTRSELTDIGIKVPGAGPATEEIALLSIPSLHYDFDELAQTINIQIASAMRIPKRFNLMPEEDLMAAQSDLGFVLNYSAFAAADTVLFNPKTEFSGASLNLDARAFSNYGVLQQTAALGTTTFSDVTATRLNTTWTYSSQQRAETYRLGDIVSGGLNWTRPVRMGGAQAQRNFSLRPDLITTPLPILQGTAEVPSTLDVYLNGMKSYTQDVPAGPFEVARLPVISSQGTARVVLTDTSGRQTTTEKPIYNSAELLSKGLFDYSADLGFARRSFGTSSFDYDTSPMALASARYGISDIITAEGHLEARSDLVEGGLGGVLQAGPFGTFNLAVAASDHAGKFGTFVYGAWDFQYENFLAHASSSRSFQDFTDLAAATAMLNTSSVSGSGVPHAIDQILVSYSFPYIQTNVGVSLSHVELSNGTQTAPVGLNVTKSIGRNISVYAGAYYDVANVNNYGASIGFSMAIGRGKDKDINIASDASYDAAGYSAQASAFKNMDSSYGSYGWRIADREQGDRAVAASASYRAPQAVVTGTVESFAGKLEGKANVEGSLVATKAGVFMGNPIYDSFAVVNVGVPDMPVSYENRYVGKTGKAGKLLLTQVRSYRPTRVSIDATNLPLNSSVTETDKRIAPREMSGVVVDFGVQKDQTAAIVVLKDPSGAFLAPGSEIAVTGHKEPFIMGYDGQVFITDLAAHNAVSADVKGKTCQAAFDYKSEANAQTVIGPLTCS